MFTWAPRHCTPICNINNKFAEYTRARLIFGVYFISVCVCVLVITCAKLFNKTTIPLSCAIISIRTKKEQAAIEKCLASLSELSRIIFSYIYLTIKSAVNIKEMIQVYRERKKTNLRSFVCLEKLHQQTWKCAEIIKSHKNV